MHLTFKQETTHPPAENQLEQQEKFDEFGRNFKVERPHQGIRMKYPSEIYKSSDRRVESVDEPFKIKVFPRSSE